MRGYDVIARSSWGASYPLRVNKEWLATFNYSPNDFKNCSGENGEQLLESLKNIMREFGESARAIVMLKSKDELQGHAIVAECRKAFVNLGDPQTGNISTNYFFSNPKLESVILLRVDNLQFTDKVKLICMNRGEFDELERSYRNS